MSKKIFIISLSLFLGCTIFIFNFSQSALAQTCSPGICCGKTVGCASSASQKTATDCASDEVCCYDSSNPGSLAQCNLAGVGHQLCSGTCQTSCQAGQTETQADDCTSQSKKCCVGTATPPSSPTTPASGSTSVSLGELQGLSVSGDPAQIIGRVIKGILGVVGAFALLMVVYGGIMMLTSAGQSEKIEKGKKVLIWAVIGTAVILGSYVLVGYVITAITGGGGGNPAPATDQCASTKPGWACETLSCQTGETATDCASRLGRNCQSGLCPGGTYNVCCEPKSTPPTDQCASKHPGWTCLDLSTICGPSGSVSSCISSKNLNCETGLCPGAAYIVCCKPPSAGAP